MALSKEQLVELYDAGMSVQEIADELGQKKSTVYYWMRKYEIKTRDRAEAQKKYVERAGSHQRSGTQHSDDTKTRISDGLCKFWDSDEGQENRRVLSEMRRGEWKGKTAKGKEEVLARLRNASRPSSNELSSFGSAFLSFLVVQGESATAKVRLTDKHLSDIVLERDKIVVEIVLPTEVYGEAAAERTRVRYDTLTRSLISAGYRVMVVTDKSNHVSRARCQRLYEALVAFREEKTKDTLTVES